MSARISNGKWRRCALLCRAWPMPDNWFRSLFRRTPPKSVTEQPVLTPANDNPWYCLATLHGEQPIEGLDLGLAQKNHAAWSRWLGGGLGDTERKEFERNLANRSSPRSLTLPDPATTADFSHTHFDRMVSFANFPFPRPADFSSVTFSGAANFGGAQFIGEAGFRSATFSGEANFSRAQFIAGVQFPSATFSKGADFGSAEFINGIAEFGCATFAKTAIFNAATFNMVSFNAATFSNAIQFVNAKFTGSTNFADARFESWVPDFRGATMHEATEWHGVTWPKPPGSKEDAQQQVYGYERLKQEMEQRKKHEDEQKFFRRELRARRGLLRTLSGEWLVNLIYQGSSDYGNSFMRRLFWLFVVFAAGTAIFVRAPLYCGAPMPVKLATKLSFANIFVFLPDKREIMMNAKMVDCLSNTTQAVSAAQSLLGVVLLFLLGLALRNRFRMR
jgi:Pentapeptide repeats (9 copies)